MTAGFIRDQLLAERTGGPVRRMEAWAWEPWGKGCRCRYCRRRGGAETALDQRRHNKDCAIAAVLRMVSMVPRTADDQGWGRR